MEKQVAQMADNTQPNSDTKSLDEELTTSAAFKDQLHIWVLDLIASRLPNRKADIGRYSSGTPMAVLGEELTGRYKNDDASEDSKNIATLMWTETIQEFTAITSIQSRRPPWIESMYCTIYYSACANFDERYEF